MIRCVAIDDEPLALKQLENYIKKIPFLHLEHSFTNALDALDYLKNNEVDLMFVDIQMPDITGIEFAKKYQGEAKIIFTTAYREHAFEGYKLDAADYLVKPISFENFQKSLEKVNERYFTKIEEIISVKHDQQFLFIKSEYKILRLELSTIKYIEGMGDYIRINMENQKPVMALLGMKKVMEFLPVNQFMRVHRSYIVNLNKITVIERNRIIFDNEVYIPISDQYKEQFQVYLENNFLK